ncbi:MAG TPA: hypothetical protein VHW60_24245 [Caulobacteraceae bacterium]|nr:hypothetical protein [Caulobacteraceae bacterium]
MIDGALGEPIIIRFDGLDADQHELELLSLSEALDGLSRIISAAAHFALTQEIATRKDKQTVRVVARAPAEGCFVVHAIVQYAHAHPMFKEYALATVSALTATAITYIFTSAAGKKEEMRHLSTALESAIRELGSRDQPTIDRLLTTVERMAENLKPAVKRAIAPIGKSARTLTVGMDSVETKVVIDEADRAAIDSPAGLTVDDERPYVVEISELDMQTGACHAAIADEPERRYPARITDPAVSLPNNPYVLSMAAKTALAVRAKATYRDGEIERLFISNTEDRPRGEPDFELR